MKKITIITILTATAFFLTSCKEEKKEITVPVEIIKPIGTINAKELNLIKWEKTWTEGEGSVEGFKSFGKEQESQRIKGLNQDNKVAILWECVPDKSTAWDGGFQTNNFSIDKTNPYLFICWVKKTNSNSGKAYYAFNGVEHTTGENISNAFFMSAGSTFSNLGEWYTLVGYIYPSNHKDNIEREIISGLYFQGEKVQQGIDYKWKTDSSETSVRVHLNNCKDYEEERLYIYNPQLYKVDGTEPKLYELL